MTAAREAESRSYPYENAELNESHTYLLPAVRLLLAESTGGKGGRLCDLGCGNGSVTNEVAKLGFEAVGIDGSDAGIVLARRAFPHLRFEHASVYDDHAAHLEPFDVVMSLEVIEHLYAPRDFLRSIRRMLRPGGTLVLSTPFHGYWKNLALALAGKWDRHFTSLTDHGHIKFWSPATLTELLTECGFEVGAFHYVGRIPPLAKSMIVVARKGSEA